MQTQIDIDLSSNQQTRGIVKTKNLKWKTKQNNRY
jgi:hypothetical protein